jgi:hypothetical protein
MKKVFVKYAVGPPRTLANWLDDLLDKLAGALFGKRRKLAKIRVRAERDY